MEKELTEKEFSNIKKQILESPDSSKKGNFDSAIVDLINILNNERDYVTTSSCSGRIVLISVNADNQKNECETWYETHEFAIEEDLASSLQKATGYLFFKFEPFVLHVQCRTLLGAKRLFDIVRNSGYKDSGLVIGKHGKIILGIRNKNNLEIPVSNGEEIIVTNSYLKYCIDLANKKMTKNFEQINRFQNAVSLHFESLKNESC
ncbi:tRNA wybutosine-synthesizing protein 3 homolog isoform X1 [Halyomorpha halys]|uniref:tRNA wybutosine-synthesizing protein 3 homolog isoform X1 n=1 Tax=Halyomorpha halys TaxID=286706 RepID=UPI0006D51E28|nr:tRNA wybutosine-synthesizing protein 3 homolog isoform X1 [Halyomorpha halys]